MQNTTTRILPVKIAFFVLLHTFNAAIVVVGLSYLQPDFTRGYLAGKAPLFAHSWFPLGLYTHAFSAPIGLLLVSLLVLFRVERMPALHRALGKAALLLLCGVIVPSGMVLSYFALGGSVGKFLFFALSSYTLFATLQGYFAILNKDLPAHRHWMREVFALLASAILLRLFLFVFQHVLHFYGDTAYCLAAFLSWVPSIIVLKALRFRAKTV